MRAARKRQGISQLVLADRAGVHPQTIVSIESGSVEHAPSVATITRTLRALGVRLRWRMDGCVITGEPRHD